MPEYVYPIDLKMNYTNNREYRSCLRKLFGMESKNYNETAKLPDLDDETRDELEYDEMAAKIAIDWIYDKLKINPLFQGFFLHAAAKFFSEDPQIGIAVLISYDYLDSFHDCIITYLSYPDDFNKLHPSYLALSEKL
jgi:hypothetical protein